jgi:serine/threonine protein kinase/tetratricopeptide (TPR) repeat protein
LASQQIAHYRILKKLGSGGMGEVFLAQDTKLGRKVAIKMLPAKSIDDEHARRRLFREAKSAATLDHPNICAIHEVNEADDGVFIVMQYVEGETLAEKLLAAPLNTDEVLDIGIQVGEALSEAHERGVIHRDIKPQNVIVTPRGQVKVLDFGLARQTAHSQSSDPEGKTETQLTEEGYIVGTVAYMSPEQLKGMPVDPRTDLFSLGVMLYECVARRLPFTGSSKIEISSKVLQVEPRKPTEINPGIPHELETIILKAMQKDAEDRYQSVEEMLRDLKGVRASMSGATELLPSVSRRTSPSEMTPAAPTAARSKWPLFALVAVPLLIIAGWIGWRLWKASPYQPTSEAKFFYDQGLSALRAGTYFQASKVLKQSVTLDSQFAPAHGRLAEAYLEISNTEQAKDELLQANALADKRSLATDDELHLDAINAMARRDFPAAAAVYQQIVDRKTGAEKANAYVDLGRAYERNDLEADVNKAIDSYTKATELDPQSAGAFLRLGIAYSRKRDTDKAEKAFQRAEQIYQVLTNQEGTVEVAFQRGVLFYNAGKLADAKAQFENVLLMLKSQANNYQLTRTELELSLVSRDEGNVARAKELAADAIRVAQNSDIKNIATNGLIDLGLAFLSNGDFDEAGNYFQQALDLARRDNATVSEMLAHLSLGRLQFQQSNNDEAIAELTKALDFYQKAGYRRETSLSLTLLGRAYQDKGDDQTALKYFDQQYQLVKDAGDYSGIADSRMNLAMLKGLNQERYTEALGYLDEKLKLDEGRDRGKAFDQINRGNFLWQLGRYDEAHAALDNAMELATKPGANLKTVVAWVHLIKARMALSQLQYAEGKKEGQQALDLSEKFPDVALQAKLTIGLAAAASGSAQQGRALCNDALAMAQKAKSRTLTISAQLALAQVMFLNKETVAAQQTALAAEKIFGQSGQKDSEWRALLIAARASEAAGDKPAANDFAARADAACATLQQTWGNEAYSGYLRRPDIQLYRQQLTQILQNSK